ncbi:MAG TPA: LysE family transporter [Candidatus Acidoferrales bacterium]|nr:LysE family transporter [Candidatus Acidoferrales bacterium]
MNLIDFLFTVVIVTASGALAPGPLFFGLLMHGSRDGARAGFSCAIGHTMVEFPLVIALALGLLAAANQPVIKEVIGLIGGVGLIGFGILQVFDTIRNKPEFGTASEKRRLPRNSIILGLALTGLNPYFILWWLTIGSILIVQALAFAAIIGVLAMYVFHVWMDYAYLTTIAHLGQKGKRVVGSRYYRLVLVAFGLVLIYYGSTFILNAIKA